MDKEISVSYFSTVRANTGLTLGAHAGEIARMLHVVQIGAWTLGGMEARPKASLCTLTLSRHTVCVMTDVYRSRIHGRILLAAVVGRRTKVDVETETKRERYRSDACVRGVRYG